MGLPLQFYVNSVWAHIVSFQFAVLATASTHFTQ